MKSFIEPLQELSGYEDMTKAAMQPGLVTISGVLSGKGCAVLSIGYPRKPSYRRADQCIAGNS